MTYLRKEITFHQFNIPFVHLVFDPNNISQKFNEMIIFPNCHMPLTVRLLQCRFVVLTLVGSNQRKYFEICCKHIHKRRTEKSPYFRLGFEESAIGDVLTDSMFQGEWKDCSISFINNGGIR